MPVITYTINDRANDRPKPNVAGYVRCQKFPPPLVFVGRLGWEVLELWLHEEGSLWLKFISIIPRLITV